VDGSQGFPGSLCERFKFATSGHTYLLGGVLFGIATFRAGILPRWADGGPADGTVAPLVLSLLLPHEFIRLAAVPVE
jgi:hypothetical protein